MNSLGAPPKTSSTASHTERTIFRIRFNTLSSQGTKIVKQDLQKMMKFYSSIVLALCLFLTTSSNAQRISDVNTIGWYNAFGTIHVNPKTSIWLEYQWRRENFVTDWQQSLARVGVKRHFKNGLAALLGYGYITHT